jgi:hypothetical protein
MDCCSGWGIHKKQIDRLPGWFATREGPSGYTHPWRRGNLSRSDRDPAIFEQRSAELRVVCVTLRLFVLVVFGASAMEEGRIHEMRCMRHPRASY